MRLFNKVAIIGTGLIGGSLGLFIKKHRLAQEVVGVSRHKKSLGLALKMKAIDRGSLSLDIIRGADLLILATPVETIVNLRKQILKIAGKGCLVTDTGSTKVNIVSFLEKTFPNYIGAHPLAGSEKCGIANASIGLFKNSLCILTPTKKTQKKALDKIKALWVKAGARVVLLSPKEHDRILSFTSHLPHSVAFSLIDSIPDKFLKFASGGLKDTTRIAASSPELWQGIFLTNKINLLESISLFEEGLNKLKFAIKNNDKKLLTHILTRAQKKRIILA
ncbi:MAG: prephenate dehydrogenase/arogenate dehydrogenase family protein [Candidatus Omnitrophota bacterium]|nr:prephenate dehydrogenase/arogenate dehydrogenase family protein [Candidatus Omnitrophota bacterium]